MWLSRGAISLGKGVGLTYSLNHIAIILLPNTLQFHLVLDREYLVQGCVYQVRFEDV